MAAAVLRRIVRLRVAAVRVLDAVLVVVAVVAVVVAAVFLVFVSSLIPPLYERNRYQCMIDKRGILEFP